MFLLFTHNAHCLHAQTVMDHGLLENTNSSFHARLQRWGPWSSQRVQSQPLWDLAEQAPELNSASRLHTSAPSEWCLESSQEAFPGRPCSARTIFFGYALRQECSFDTRQSHATLSSHRCENKHCYRLSCSRYLRYCRCSPPGKRLSSA